LFEHTFYYDGREPGMCDTAAMPALNPSLPVPLAMVVAGLQAMAAQTPVDIPGAQALLEAQVLLNQTDVIKALSLQRIADVDTRQLHTLDDSPSTSAWVAEQQTSMPRSDVALARKLGRFPLLAARLTAGGLSLEGGVLISRTLGSLRPYVDRPNGCIDGQPSDEVLPAVIIDGISSQVARARGGVAADDPGLLRLIDELTVVAAQPLPELRRLEAAFLVLARCVEPGDLKPCLEELAGALLPNVLAQRAEDGHRDRRLDLQRKDDGTGWSIRGDLDLECGELLHTSMTAAMETDPDNPFDTATDARLRADGLDPYLDGCVEVRSLRQRRHDGLKLALRRLLDSGAIGSRGKHVPHVGVTIGEAALHDQPGALPGRATSGAIWPAGLVRRLLCDSAITRFVLSLGHRVVESSHTERTLKPHQRRIKNLETGGICQGAGCGRGDPTGHRLIPHHVIAYSICGTTSLEDTVLVCELTHHDLHEGGKTIRLKHGRRLNAAGWVTDIAA
jgi:hypothetical protein